MASQPMMSRLLALLGKKDNLSALKVALMKLSCEHISARNNGRRQEEMFIDIDGMPLDAHGRQNGSAEWKGSRHMVSAGEFVERNV